MEVAGLSRLPCRPRAVLLADCGKTGEAVKAVDAAREVDGLQHRAQLGPGHESEATVHAALDHRALHRENSLEDLVVRKGPAEMLAAHVVGEVLDPDLNRIRIGVEDLRGLGADRSLLLGAKWFGVGATAHRRPFCLRACDRSWVLRGAGAGDRRPRFSEYGPARRPGLRGPAARDARPSSRGLRD